MALLLKFNGQKDCRSGTTCHAFLILSHSMWTFVKKVMVAIDSLGNIVWICLLSPKTSADVLIWDPEGPKRYKGHVYMYYEMSSMDGATRGASIWHGHLSVERF